MSAPQLQFLVLASLFLLAEGCSRGPKQIPTAAVSGQVTLDGAPLNQGIITFFPDLDTSGAPLEGQMVQARISNGGYTLANPPGVTVGKNKVTISSTKVVGKESKDGVEIEKREEILPAKFNVNTTLAIDVAAPETKGDFELKSK